MRGAEAKSIKKNGLGVIPEPFLFLLYELIL